MHQNGFDHRCQTLIAELDSRHAWQLPLTEQLRYAAQVAALGVDASIDDGHLRTVLSYYHSEHRLVEALIDRAHSDHDSAWVLVGAQVRRILASKAASAHLADQALSLEDLAQEALIDLSRGLPQFRYQSRLQTWLFTLVGHCLHRALRAQGAQKRGEHALAQSLEALQAANGDGIAESQREGLEDAANLRVLAGLLAEVLGRHPDRRLGAIMQLWLVEDLPLRQIGQRLELSVGRVHGLLNRALELLRADPALRLWAAEGVAENAAALNNEPIAS